MSSVLVDVASVGSVVAFCVCGLFLLWASLRREFGAPRLRRDPVTFAVLVSGAVGMLATMVRLLTIAFLG